MGTKASALDNLRKANKTDKWGKCDCAGGLCAVCSPDHPDWEQYVPFAPHPALSDSLDVAILIARDTASVPPWAEGRDMPRNRPVHED